ncbi:YlbG family protein [Facklamia languida]
MTFEVVKRQSLVVWLYTLKQWKQLRKFGTVHFISDRLKYVILYVNEADASSIMTQLKSLNFVREVEPSYRDEIDMTFKDSIPDRIDPDLKKEEKPTQTDYKTFFKDLAQSIEQEATEE